MSKKKMSFGPKPTKIEFWLTLGTFIVSGFVLTGVISQDSEDYIGSLIEHATEITGLIIVQVGVIGKYILRRRQLKKEEGEDSGHRESEIGDSGTPREDSSKPKKPW